MLLIVLEKYIQYSYNISIFYITRGSFVALCPTYIFLFFLELRLKFLKLLSLLILMFLRAFNEIFNCSFECLVPLILIILNAIMPINPEPYLYSHLKIILR